MAARYSDSEGLMGNTPSKRHDPFNLGFDKEFQEEYDTVRSIQKTCYYNTRKGCFNFMSLLIGIILAFIWGIIMGITQFFLIWVIVPSVKVWKLYWTPAASLGGALLNALFGPCLKNVAARGATINVNGNDIEKQ